MAWVSFIERTDEDSCTTCNGYGGIYDDETFDTNGEPHSMQCPDCSDLLEEDIC